MEKTNNMQQNKIDDEELDQVSGGFFILDAFLKETKPPFTASTAEYTTDDPKNKFGLNTLEMLRDEKNDISLSTLEMRTNPLKKEEKNTRKILKL